MKKFVLLFIYLFLQITSVTVMAHEGEPNMAFLWRDGNIEVDTAFQGRALGERTAFVIPFTDTLSPYRTGDAGFNGSGFGQGGIFAYQIESTLLKWSAEQSQWLQDGFLEQIVISRLAVENIVTSEEGTGLQGFIATLANSSTFEAHPIFRIQKDDGTLPDDGAYMVFINVLGLDDAGEQIRYRPSEPFALVFHINTQSGFGLLALSEALGVVPDVELNDYRRIDTLFDWAQSQFSDLFPHAAESRFIFGYYARCYDNAVCLGSKDGAIYTAGGILGDITEQGPITVFYDMAGL